MRRRNPVVERIAWLPVPLFLAVIIALWALDLHAVHESPSLLILLNLLFSTLTSLFIAYLVGRSFLDRGTPGLLMLGCGVLVWGVSGTLAAGTGLEMGVTAANFANVSVTIHNLCAWIAAACYLAGAVLSLRPRSAFRATGLTLAVAYTASFCLVGSIALTAHAGRTPIFFLQGQGGTPLRQIVLGSAVVMFALTALVLRWPAGRAPSPFVRWYATAVALIATGLLGVLLERSSGNALGWTGRAAQFLGGVYMLLAAIASVRESHGWGISLEVALRETEERFRTLAAAAFEGIAITEAGRITDVNEAFAGMLGYGRDELIGREVASLIPPADRQRVLANILDGVESRIEHAVIRKVGGILEVEAHGRNTSYRGRSVRITAIRDITERKRMAAALEAAARKYSTMFDTTSDGVWIHDLSGRILEVNDAYCRMSGYERDELLGTPVSRLEAKESAEQVAEHLRKLLQTGGHDRFESRHRRKDGSLFDVDITALHVAIDGGCVAIFVRDVTERKRAEQALRESEERFRLIASSTPDHLLVQDRDLRYTLVINPQLGLTEEQMIGRTDHDFLPKETADRLTSIKRRVLSTGEAARIEIPLLSLDGRQEFFDGSYVPTADAEGRISGLIGYFRNVTIQRRTEQALRESEERFRSLFNGMTEGFALHEIIVDGDGVPCDYRFLDLNPAFERLTGLKKEEVVGRTYSEVLPNDSPRWVEEYGRVALLGTPAHFQNYSPALKRHYEVFAYRPAPRQFAVVFRDITDRKRAEAERERLLAAERAAAEEAARANRAKDDFLAVLSHELRTPLTPVLLAASLLETRHDLPADAVEDIRVIRRHVQMEARLIDDLLDLTRVARGKMQFDFMTTDIHLLIRAAAEIFRRDDLPAVNLALEAAHRHVRADGARLQQVFWNLLSNASRFTPREGSVTVRSFNRDDRVRVEVRDTGVGIEPELVPRLFTPFQQGRERGRHGGLGLGLAISRAIVEAHGGVITAASEGVGRGATFEVDLPCEFGVPVAYVVPASTEQSLARDRALKILVVEDHPTTLEMMKKLLEQFGHDVRAATGVEEALAAAAREPFDLVISDLGLPDGSGHELMDTLRRRHGLLGIALSGYGMEHDVERSRAAGFVEHLTKPVEIETLRASIAAALTAQSDAPTGHEGRR